MVRGCIPPFLDEIPSLRPSCPPSTPQPLLVLPHVKNSLEVYPSFFRHNDTISHPNRALTTNVATDERSDDEGDDDEDDKKAN